MRYLLDTSALLAHYRKEAGWKIVQDVFESGEAEILVASVSLPEFGRRLLELGASEADAHEAIINYRLLCSDTAPIDADVALSAFSIACQTPLRLPLVDALIAAAAQTHNATLVHRDKHMRAIPVELLEQRYLDN